jgi:hypothetical protein
MTTAAPTSPRTATPGPVRSPTVTEVLLIVVVLAAVAAVQGPVGRTSPGPRTEDPCPRVVTAERVFPAPFLGEVYAQFAGGPVAAPTVVTLSWGRWQWRHEVVAAPGLVHLGQGGTVLLFTKTGGTVGLNPRLRFESSTPVCVVLRTAHEGTPRPRRVYDANPDWTFREPPFTSP